MRGLADCLRNELQGTGVAVSVAYPPDTGGWWRGEGGGGGGAPLRRPWQCANSELRPPGRHAADTPGYAIENESKPALCKAVNDAMGSQLFTSDQARPAATHDRGTKRAALAAPSGRRMWRLRHAHRVPTDWPCCPAATLPQVARVLLRGIEAGVYHLPSPDLGQNLLVSAMTSLRWALGPGAWAEEGGTV